jgi:WD40 repeat protein
MDDGVRIWEIASGREAAFLPIRRTRSVFFQPDGRELMTCGDTGLHRWPIPARTDSAEPFQLGPPQRMTLPFSIPESARRSRDGRLIAVASQQSGVALVLDAATGAMRTPLLEHPSVGYVALSPDEKWLATAGWHSQLVRLWNVQTGQMAREWTTPGASHIGFTPDSREVVRMLNEECGFWSVETFQRVRRVPRNASAYPTPAAFSPDEKLVAVEVTPGVIQLTELATGRLVATLTDPFGDRATWMSFTPDGTQLVTAAAYSRAIHVWDLRRIRARLKTMGLDWKWPEFPAAE